jgi:hypothetical protein
LGEFIGDLANNNSTALATVPGVTSQIIGAGVGGLFNAYALAFRYVWIAASCFAVAAVVCKSHHPPKSPSLPIVSRANIHPPGSAFLVDPVKEFNMHINAPVEREEDNFGPVR